MLKSILAFGAAAALAMPASLMAQDAPPEAAPVSQPATNYSAKVNFNLSEDRDNILLLDLSNGQRVAVRLMPEWAPNHVERVKTLSRQGFYDGVIFHRVIDGFMAQSGDPTGTGQGGSQLPDLEEEFNPLPHVRGTISMARGSEEDSANSQFFIVFYPRFSLDKRYTNFGRVISGMEAVDAINRGEPPADPTRILQASIASDNRPVPVMPQPAPAEEISVEDLSAPLEAQ
ncbi:peptidylprolyl isomerase [Qipengyuania atrilutea]|uniref:Peptidyl-prolyl cis-trans isomerase n=1 Tax=Qipengyuania atrilutea TaxID=2744473 RepID=A0A850GW08_9SPHN|nr:peptidylprolyl isomerase [Actirhodobacter atriluteus]NVD43724.1 peptidylprolyl isomerase [Actirhodobacter atriluteus]